MDIHTGVCKSAMTIIFAHDVVEFAVTLTSIIRSLLKYLQHIRGSHSCPIKCDSSLQSGVYKDKYYLLSMSCIPHIECDSEDHKYDGKCLIVSPFKGYTSYS